MAKEPAVVGIDLGGLHLRLAIVTPMGEIVARWERLTATMPDQDSLVTTLAADLATCGLEGESRGFAIQGVGVGVPGRVLSREGRVVFSPNIPALNDFPILSRLQPLVPWPVFLDNDANMFILGECWRGGGVGYSEVLGITLGMGVGGGLMLGDRLWRGPAGVAGEIGHITVDPEGSLCRCGNRGCLETLASGSWAVSWVKEQLARGAASWLEELYEKDPEALQGEALVAAALQRDPLARRAFDRVGRALGQGIAAVVHLLGIPRVIIGGRFAQAWEVFRLPMLEELHRRLTLLPPAEVLISPSELGDDAGLLGAARLAWESLGER
jgi:glucokinase